MPAGLQRRRARIPSATAGWTRPGRRVIWTAPAPELEAQGLKVVLAKEPTVVAGHAVTSGQIPRLIDFEKPRR